MRPASRISVGRAHARSCALVILLALTSACAEDPPPATDNASLAINLRWVASYPRERQSDVESGLLWTLSFLGAGLPDEGPSALTWSGDVVTLRLDRAGISAEALPHWERLVTAMKASGEYRSSGALDIGRFVALTLCSAWHYYALTGASPRYEDARAEHELDPQPVAIIESSVAIGNRLIEMPVPSSGIAFVAHEIAGSVQEGRFEIVEHELLAVMPNGQLRFALYDLAGALKPSASATLTAAGKPSKCLWCHETHLLGPFEGRTSIDGYQSLRDFERGLAELSDRLSRHRTSLRSRIDFGREQDHTYAELLYLGFYEPTIERLANEWRITEESARELLSGFPTHPHSEFPFLGDALYRRSEVDVLAPYDVLEVPTDPREPSGYEPNLLQ